MFSSSRVTRSEECLQNSRAVAETTSVTHLLIFENLTSLRVVFFSCTARVKKGCVSTLESMSGHCGLFVKVFENTGSVRWLRQDDKESGEEFLKRTYQQAADEGTPGLAFSASGSLGIGRPAGKASSGFSMWQFEVSIGLLFDCVRPVRH